MKPLKPRGQLLVACGCALAFHLYLGWQVLRPYTPFYVYEGKTDGGTIAMVGVVVFGPIFFTLVPSWFLLSNGSYVRERPAPRACLVAFAFSPLLWSAWFFVSSAS